MPSSRCRSIREVISLSFVRAGYLLPTCSLPSFSAWPNSGASWTLIYLAYSCNSLIPCLCPGLSTKKELCSLRGFSSGDRSYFVSDALMQTRDPFSADIHLPCLHTGRPSLYLFSLRFKILFRPSLALMHLHVGFDFRKHPDDKLSL